MDELLAKLRQAEQERDEAAHCLEESTKHLQAIVTAYADGALFIGGTDGPMLVDAIVLADFYLKGGI